MRPVFPRALEANARAAVGMCGRTMAASCSSILPRAVESLPEVPVVSGDLMASVGVLPRDADPTLTIGWDERAVDYDHVIDVLMN